jgi:hypothetical protein
MGANRPRVDGALDGTFSRPRDAREIFADGSWESETPRFPESVVFEDLATVKAPVVSDCGSVVSSSSPEELVYCRQMSWKKSSCPALYNLAHALKEDKLGKGRAHAPY